MTESELAPHHPGKVVSLDDNSVTQNFYIATESSPADDRTRVLKYGTVFPRFDRYGDVGNVGLKEQGIFCEGASLSLQLNLTQLAYTRPLLLSSTIKADNSQFAADLANVDISRDGQVVIPRGTLHVLRTKFLWQGVCYEQFRGRELREPARWTSLSDCALPPTSRTFSRSAESLPGNAAANGSADRVARSDGEVVLSYRGLDDVVRRLHVVGLPAPKRISASEIQFDAYLEPKGQATFNLTFVCEVGPASYRQPKSCERAWGLHPGRKQ